MDILVTSPTCSAGSDQLQSLREKILKKSRYVLVIALIQLLTVGIVISGRIATVPLVERGIWIGAYSPPSPWESMVSVHDLEQSIGRRLDVIHLYKAWGEPWGSYNAETIRELVSATADGRRALITWEPWVLSNTAVLSNPGQQSRFSLASIVAGDHDAYIRSWAEGLRELSDIVYLRPMHEMNGNWYPWAGGIEGNRAIDYIAVWRHMYEIFEQSGADNVRWVWSPYAEDVPSSNVFEEYYPGDEYVDILALDAYNWGTGTGPRSAQSTQSTQSTDRWQDVDDLLSDPYRRLTRLGPQPVWLAEVSSAERGGDKADWLQKLLALRGYKRISAVIWFDVDKERDWRISSSERAAAAVARALSGTRPANESEVAPAKPAEAVAHGMRRAAQVQWSGIGQGAGVSHEVTTYAAGKIVRRDVTTSGGLYVVPDLDAGVFYTFIVRTFSRFGGSSRSAETPPVMVTE